jgi:membrane-bound lytic murein transglycosylase D
MVLNLQDPRKRGEEIEIVRVPAPTPLRTVVAESTTETENQVKSSPEPTQRSAAPSKVTHTVSSGETLFAISKKYGISVDELKSWNGIGSQNIISIGQKLVIHRP